MNDMDDHQVSDNQSEPGESCDTVYCDQCHYPSGTGEGHYTTCSQLPKCVECDYPTGRGEGHYTTCSQHPKCSECDHFLFYKDRHYKNCSQFVEPQSKDSHEMVIKERG